MATHLFNGMTGLHHREPGVAASVLTHPTAAASLIADGVHVHPRMLLLAASVLGPERTVLVTDAVAWRAGAAGPVRLELRDGAARLPSGTLAGSATTMDACVRTMVDAGVPLEHALRAASTVPARLLGRTDRGRDRAGPARRSGAAHPRPAGGGHARRRVTRCSPRTGRRAGAQSATSTLADTCSTRRRTTISGGTALRRP